MAARIYATSEDYTAYTGDESSEAPARLLRAASRIVGHAARFAVYATDEAGMPTSVRVREAFTEATCAQVEWWEEMEDETGAGADANVQSASIGGVAFTMAPGAPVGQELCDTARLILAEAGLLQMGVAIHG